MSKGSKRNENTRRCGPPHADIVELDDEESDTDSHTSQLWFIFLCYHNVYDICLLHDFVATLRLSALPFAWYFVLSKLALSPPHFNSCSLCFP